MEPHSTESTTRWPTGVMSLYLQHHLTERATVMLATARINVEDKYRNQKIVRALIDSGSKVSIASESLVHRLKLARQSDSTTIFSVGGSKTGYARGRVSLKITSRINQEFNLKISALILPRVTINNNKTPKKNEAWTHLQGISLADPKFSDNDPIELILGADVYAIIIQSGVRKGTGDMQVACRTALGWILSGTAGGGIPLAVVNIRHCTINNELEAAVVKFWQQTREDSGRYSVRLPFIKAKPEFPNSQTIALSNFLNLEKRLSHQPKIRLAYITFMQEYQNLGHMSATTAPINNNHCYLPHHAVVKLAKNDATPQKLLVVFNGSACFGNSGSLNDSLLSGPNLLPSLADIISNWQKYRIAVTANIKTMYRQINIHSENRQYQRILWRENPNDKILDYTLNTVTYGLTSAPFFAIRVLRQLALDEEENYPKGASVLRQKMYMDDILTGADTVIKARELITQVINIAKAGGFMLAKWAVVGNKHGF
ncbi:uncharacterized protein [Cardiocondyla obscurior]|uniref:uncharacterized protein n=1 Tax=Cardiocondyla obscurior TaxID=286306 RepID=UPI00396573B8